jgi:hypothetical protein
MTHLVSGRVLAAAALVSLPALAPAEEPGAPEVDRVGTEAELALAPVNLMAGTAPARLNPARITVTSWGGYDGAGDAARVSAGLEARLLRRLAIGAGVASSSDTGSFELRPQLALRFQIALQEDAGIDATVSASYRQDRFELDGGFLQGTLALGRRFDRLRLALNASFGADPEGDDFEGEVRCAALVEARPGFYLGVDGRYQHDLGSTDPRRAHLERPSMEALAAVATAYVHGRWAIMLEAGLSLVTTESTRTGPIALAGYSANF